MSMRLGNATSASGQTKLKFVPWHRWRQDWGYVAQTQNTCL